MTSTSEENRRYDNSAVVQSATVPEISSLEGCVAFINKPQLLKSANLSSILEKHVKSADDIAKLLQGIETFRFVDVLSCIQPYFENFVTFDDESVIKKTFEGLSEWKFVRLLEYLSLEKREVVCNVFLGDLKDIIKSSLCFQQLLKILSSEQREKVYLSMKDILTGIINNDGDLAHVLKYLTTEHCEEACRAIIGDRSAYILVGWQRISSLLGYLDYEKCEVVCDVLKGDFRYPITNSSYTFALVLENLDARKRSLVYNAVKDALNDTVKNSLDLVNVLKYLSPEDCTDVCNRLENKLNTIIRNGFDLFCTVFKGLPTSEQFDAVCAVMKNRLQYMVYDLNSFKIALRHSNTNSYKFLCQTLQREPLSKIIKNNTHFQSVVEELNPEQFVAVLDVNVIQYHLLNLVKDKSDFKLFISSFQEDKQAILLKSGVVSSLLPKIIQRIHVDMHDICNVLLERNREIFFKACLENFIRELDEYGGNNLEYSEAIKNLCDNLRREKENYFNTSLDAVFAEFKTNSENFLNTTAKSLSANSSVSILGCKILIAILTLGLVLLFSAAKSKYQTGNWQCRFFRSSAEDMLDRGQQLFNAYSTISLGN